ncbi:pyrimidine 5'-nucleotidase [Mycotypha africana]|uniref:pyrimidine 5'-nucleotidase n=1 Tax=Mycotypha africana TaxID=64632 RepID=UPI002301F06D|nr:pyrimidine 5'-nucleotidase [Mycotypha africana]KAI8975602.1 pyrimidine 5'-nucleotidase [Mycotypha africana]
MTHKPVCFFDVDDTLYNKDLNVLSLMRKKIQDYFVNELGIPADEVAPLQRKYQATYGLSLRGVQIDYNVDPLDYDRKVDQALPLDGLIKRDDKLIKMLKGMNCKKWVFTNAFKPHAVRCLKLLGVENEFDGLTYTNYLVPNFNCKPEPAAFHRAMKNAGVTDPKLCYLVDDSIKNIEAAQKMGWTTVHVAGDASTSTHGDYQIDEIHDLPNVLPELWEPHSEKMKLRRQSIGVTTAA